MGAYDGHGNPISVRPSYLVFLGRAAVSSLEHPDSAVSCWHWYSNAETFVVELQRCHRKQGAALGGGGIGTSGGVKPRRKVDIIDFAFATNCTPIGEHAYQDITLVREGEALVALESFFPSPPPRQDPPYSRKEQLVFGYKIFFLSEIPTRYMQPSVIPVSGPCRLFYQTSASALIHPHLLLLPMRPRPPSCSSCVDGWVARDVVFDSLLETAVNM